MATIQSIERPFSQAAAAYNNHAEVQGKMSDELLERLDFFNLQPEVVVDLGGGTGLLAQGLTAFYPKAHIVQLDIAPAMLEQAQQTNEGMVSLIQADAHAIPLKEGSVDLVITNAMLQWSYNLEQLFQSVQKVLRTDGVFIFATFGPDTLMELRKAWAQTDPTHPHVNYFFDMHDLGDLLMHSGFADPVMDRSMMRTTHQSAKSAISSLRGVGSSNQMQERRSTLTGAKRWQAMVEAWQALSADHAFSLTYEVVFGHCFKGAPRAAKHASPFIITPDAIQRA